MSKETLIAALDQSVEALPGGVLSGGTKLSAARFVEQVRPLSEAEIRAEMASVLDHASGPFRDWLASVDG